MRTDLRLVVCSLVTLLLVGCSDADPGLSESALTTPPTVRAASSGSGNNKLSMTIAKPAGALPSDLLVAVIAHDSGTTYSVATPAGWTYVPSLTASVSYGTRTYVFWRVAGAS